jgi:hypothetical protein
LALLRNGAGLFFDVSVQDTADPLSGVVVPNTVATKDVKAATQGICFDLEFS